MKNNILGLIFLISLLYSCSNKKKERIERSNLEKNDTVFVFNKNGNLKEKGLKKGENRIGWWSKYDENEKLISKVEYYVREGESRENQTIHFDKLGNINKGKGSFFEIEINDTLVIGENIGKVSVYNTDKFGDYKLISVILDNEYQNNIVLKDTFSDGTQTPSFKLYLKKEGNQTIKGLIEEKILIEKEISPDSSILRIENYYKYFEKDVFVKKKN